MLKAIVKACLFTPMSGGRWGLPVIYWGEPGIAKTAVIEEVAASFGLPCETLSPSERGEAAFGVVPVPDGTGKDMVLVNPRPEWTRKFDATGRGIVYVDEVTSTPPALQAPLMGLIHARRIGGHTLAPGVRIIAAANGVDLAAGGYELSAPVANRFGHIDWETPTVEEHAAYMMRGSSGTGDGDIEVTDAVKEEERVLEGWGEAWAGAVGFETAFLSRFTHHKNKCPKASDPQVGRAWPSDRTWEFATRAYASGIVNGLSQQERERFVEAFISQKIASEWFEYIEKQDLPDPAELLDGKASFKHNPQRVDRTVAVLSACTALVSPQNAKDRTRRAGAMWDLLEEMTSLKADHDILVPSVYTLIDSNLHSMKNAAKTLALINPVLRAAGVTPKARR